MSNGGEVSTVIDASPPGLKVRPKIGGELIQASAKADTWVGVGRVGGVGWPVSRSDSTFGNPRTAG